MLEKHNYCFTNPWPEELALKHSAAHLHLKNNEHSFEESNVHILAREERSSVRGVKETIYIKLEQPSPNRWGRYTAPFITHLLCSGGIIFSGSLTAIHTVVHVPLMTHIMFRWDSDPHVTSLILKIHLMPQLRLNTWDWLSQLDNLNWRSCLDKKWNIFKNLKQVWLALSGTFGITMTQMTKSLLTHWIFRFFFFVGEHVRTSLFPKALNRPLTLVELFG